MGHDFALKTGLAARINVGCHLRGTGNESNRRLADWLFGRAALCFLCLTGAAAWWRAPLSAPGGLARRDPAAGAGMGGSVFGRFVLFCATALVASIIPKINQQFIFIIYESKVFISVLSMSAIGPVSVRPA